MRIGFIGSLHTDLAHIVDTEMERLGASTLVLGSLVPSSTLLHHETWQPRNPLRWLLPARALETLGREEIRDALATLMAREGRDVIYMPHAAPRYDTKGNELPAMVRLPYEGDGRSEGAVFVAPSLRSSAEGTEFNPGYGLRLVRKAFPSAAVSFFSYPTSPQLHGQIRIAGGGSVLVMGRMRWGRPVDVSTGTYAVAGGVVDEYSLRDSGSMPPSALVLDTARKSVTAYLLDIRPEGSRSGMGVVRSLGRLWRAYRR